MYLAGSRNIGVHNKHSDFDYAVIDDREGYEIINERIDKKHHCYHYPKKYRDDVAHFNVERTDDFIWLYNVEDYKSGLIDVNPFDYKEKWIGMLKTMDFFNRVFFIPNVKIIKKRVYHIVYNLECLKANSIYLNEEATSRVKEWHDAPKTLEEYHKVIQEIQKLC